MRPSLCARRLVLRQALLTLALASAPALLLSMPALLVAAGASGRPLLAFVSGAVPLAGVMLLAGAAGIAAALLLVRLVPPRRARLLAAFLSATGLAVALVGFRAARPERLLDPVEALSVVTRLGTAPPSPPGLDPAAWAARAATRGLFGDTGGLLPGTALLLAGLAAFLLVPATLWRLHLHVFRESSTGSRRAGRPSAPRPGGPLARGSAHPRRSGEPSSRRLHARAARIAGGRVPARPDERPASARSGRHRARPRRGPADGPLALPRLGALAALRLSVGLLGRPRGARPPDVCRSTRGASSSRDGRSALFPPRASPSP